MHAAGHRQSGQANVHQPWERQKRIIQAAVGAGDGGAGAGLAHRIRLLLRGSAAHPGEPPRLSLRLAARTARRPPSPAAAAPAPCMERHRSSCTFLLVGEATKPQTAGSQGHTGAARPLASIPSTLHHSVLPAPVGVQNGCPGRQPYRLAVPPHRLVKLRAGAGQQRPMAGCTRDMTR